MGSCLLAHHWPLPCHRLPRAGACSEQTQCCLGSLQVPCMSSFPSLELIKLTQDHSLVPDSAPWSQTLLPTYLVALAFPRMRCLALVLHLGSRHAHSKAWGKPTCTKVSVSDTLCFWTPTEGLCSIPASRLLLGRLLAHLYPRLLLLVLSLTLSVVSSESELHC